MCVVIREVPITALGSQEDSSWTKRQWSAVSGLAVGALVVTGLTAPMQAQATPIAKAPVSGDPAAAQASQPDNLPNPLAEAQTAERKDAVAKLLKGEATTKTINGNRVIEVKSKGTDKNGKPKKSKYVNYPVDREEDIFTILTDFGDKTMAGQSTAPGPVHNQIAAPDRKWDGNSTDDNVLAQGLQPPALHGHDVRQRRVVQGLLPSSPTAVSWPRVTSPTG